MTESAIFVTGASGFIGRHLLRRLDSARFPSVYCLSRKNPSELAELSAFSHLHLLRGSLFDTAAYEPALARSRVVVHLAAATGKAARKDHFRVNLEGTRLLVELCRKHGVGRFVFVSSIAARFSNKTRYHYAESKQRAEDVVRQSGLHFLILRPTIVLGPRSPVGSGLARLARLPIIPIFGDGKARIQPIHVEDLTELLVHCLDTCQFDGETLELGGSDAIPMEEFLCRAHQSLCRTRARTVHIPFALIVPLLTLLDVPFHSLLPVTAGQLASFRNDGTTASNRLVGEHTAGMKTIEEMLRSLDSDDAV